MTMADKDTTKTSKGGMNRRTFLKVLGGGAAALAVGVVVGGPTIVREARLRINQAFLAGDAPSSAPPESPFVWIEVGADNQALLYIPKVELGQGIHTTLAQIAADEMELDWQQVTAHQADTARGFDPQLIFTFGSTSVTSLYAPIREIGATLREMLRAEAAVQLGVAASDVTAADSAVFVTDNADRRLTYGEIIAAKQGEWTLPATKAALKPASSFRYIGQSVQRVDLRDKVTGRAVYGYDVRLDGMVYGAVARPPRYGATLARAAEGTAGSQLGVIAVVIKDGFAGVVAETRRKARAALGFLDLQWEGGTTITQAEIEQTVAVPHEGGTLIQRDGDVDSAGGRRVEASYRVPMAIHAQMEPQAAAADVQADRAMIYCSTQAPGLTRERIAAAIGMDENTIDVVPTMVGGGFGRKTGVDVGVEAALLSQAAGVPVHVGWSREEDTQYGYRRPPAANHLWATLDDAGEVLAIHHEIASSDILLNPQVGSAFLGTVLGTDPLAAYGGLIHYSIPNRRVVYHHTPIPVPTAYWRGLGSFPNTFAIESFIDEVAEAAALDPLDFRLRYLPEGELGERFTVVLNAVAEASGWRERASLPEGRALGIASAYDRGTVVGVVAEVSVVENTIRVEKAWCAVDPGLVVNPDGAAAQVQGSIVWGVGSALIEEQLVENGMATSQNFNTYPLLTIAQTPDMIVLPISSGDAPVGGLGEPVVGAVPPAIANALAVVTGRRFRQMPFRL
jgi:isoquinoline 1-oxidoreductase beta subunit